MSLIFALYRYYPTVNITLCFSNARTFDKLNESSKFLLQKEKKRRRTTINTNRSFSDNLTNVNDML